MYQEPDESPNELEPQTILVDTSLDVKQYVNKLVSWEADFKQIEYILTEKFSQLDLSTQAGKLTGAQITSLLRRLRLTQVKQPLQMAQGLDLDGTRSHLIKQFPSLTKAERLIWLKVLLFIITPDLADLRSKIENIRSYRSFGQQRNFLLGGHSGMGKTTFLDWFCSNSLPTVESTYNRIPVIKIDAPVSNHSAKPLLQRIILECGKNFNSRNNEEELLMQIAACFQKCQVEVLVVDEVEHIVRPEIRRRLLEVSNMTRGIPIICASCNPHRFIFDDVEVQGRWNDYFELKPYKGDRLPGFLSFIEMLLPFTRNSNLTDTILNTPDGNKKGPATLIEEWTGGILRDIMMLIFDACKRAINQDLPCLTPQLLEDVWKDIQTQKTTLQ